VRRERRELGQASGEYAIVVGVIVVVCIVAALFLGLAIRGQFGSASEPVQPAPFEPPRPAPVTWPTTLADCEDGGWRNYPQFRNETECREYIERSIP
jgi:Flp pilus assembly pilin Flp